MADDAAPFPYMRWAKANLPPSDPQSLGLSGLHRPDPADLPLVGDPFEGGVDPEVVLPGAIGEHCGVNAERVYPTAGASHANFLVYLAFARDGVVAAETPTYEVFHRLGAAVGAEVRPFGRCVENGWRIDADALEAAAADGDLDLIALTDLHNPSGARLHDDDLALAIEVAETHDAVVLVDEVYLDLDPTDRPTAAHRSDRVLVTNSLTKSHGMWDLRAGWVLGSPTRLREIASWDDLVCPRLPQLALRETLRFLPVARERLTQTRARCEAATERVDAWVAARDDVWWTRPPAGFTGFLRLGSPERELDGDHVAKLAWERAGIRVVPGSFFQAPTWIRISYLLENDERLDRSLAGLGDALDEAGRA